MTLVNNTSDPVTESLDLWVFSLPRTAEPHLLTSSPSCRRTVRRSSAARHAADDLPRSVGLADGISMTPTAGLLARGGTFDGLSKQ